MSSSNNSSPYSQLLSKLTLPQPQLARHAVASLFKTLALSSSSSSSFARDAIAQCLRSPSPAVVDQAVRELCRLFRKGLVEQSVALLELQSALEGCDARSVGVFVKGIGFLCRVGFGADWDWAVQRFDPVELHPFVKVLSLRDEAQAELIQQVLLFIAHNRTVGMEAVIRFLRPFFMFSIIRKSLGTSSSTFARDLISAVAALSCSLPSEAISIFKLLTECLKFFPCTNEVEFKHFVDSAEYVVDAFVVVLKQIVGTDVQLTSAIQTCGLEAVVLLFSLCAYTHKTHGAVEFIVELSKRLLVAQKELGLRYVPEFSIVMVSISAILIQTQFEHEHLSILKLLVFLFKWRTENDHNSEGAECYLCEEFLYIFPVISLLSSPSKSIKASAAFLLSAVEKLLLDLLNLQVKPVASEDEFLHIIKQKSIPFRLLHHLWFQESSRFPRSTYLGLACSIVSEVNQTYSGLDYWTHQLSAYLKTIKNLEVTSLSQSSEDLATGTHMLLSSIASILVMHPMLGSSAVDSLAAIGLVDPKLAMPLLQALLFYNKMLCSYGSNSAELLLRLFEVLPLLASHSSMVPLILQTILPMLQKDANQVLHAVAIRLLCKTWIITDRAFGTMQEILDPKELSVFISKRQICISIAGSVRDICRHDPDRGVDLILSVSSCIESCDSTVRALGFESLAYLCAADVVDFYTAWDVVENHSMNYFIDPIVAHGLCILLRWGAMDAAAYPERAKTVMQILWNVATSRKSCSALLWVKARISAFKSLSHYEVEHVQDLSSDFRETSLHCLVTEDNTKVLMAMEEFIINIINFEHINRRRVNQQKRNVVHKVEKLLDVFPQVIFSQGNQKFNATELPGAALLSLVFTPRDMQGTSKDLAKLHSSYEKALLEISESLHVSRNILIALLALQSWKAFICRWIGAVTHANSKGLSDVSDKSAEAANEILKILCKVAAEALPRVAVNIALAIGALCSVVPSTSHSVTSVASNFLLKWLGDQQHEHKQWSAAISSGLVCSCLHTTDRTQKSKVITELLKVLSNSNSCFVKGACGMGLGFACQDLLTRIGVDNLNPEGSSSRLEEMMLVRNIIRTLSMALSQLCPSASDSLRNIHENFLIGGDDAFNEEFLNFPYQDSNNVEEDAWGIAGLVLGFGNSVVAIYRSGDYDAVLKIKEMLMSWVPQVDSSLQSFIFCREMSEVPLSMGACLVLPTVIAFCRRTELIEDDPDLVYRYGSLISALMSSKKSGALYQDVMMASCVGAGSFLSCILSDGMHSVRVDDAKYLLGILRDTYTRSCPPSVYLGGMLGVVNAFGASAGVVTRVYPMTTSSQLDNEQDSSCIMGSLLSSPIWESLTTSIIQELFLLAKESRDQQIKQYSAWAISFLREKWWSKELQNINSQVGSTYPNVSSQNFAEDSLVMKLCLWLGDVDVTKSDMVIQTSTVSTVLRCLSKAPRLPTLEWGAIIRRCMRYGAKTFIPEVQCPESLREECIRFSLAHANNFSPLLLFLDELTDLSRFGTLELNLKCTLLHHLPDVLKIFSGSRLDKLFEDLVAYFSSSGSPYFSYDLDQRTLLRVSFWKGLHQCLNGTLKEPMHISRIEKCMQCLFSCLPVLTCYAGMEAQVPDGIEEWSAAMRCFSKASQGWLMDVLQVSNIDKFHEGTHVDEVVKRISTRARLVKIGHIPISEMDKIKAYILNTRLEGSWWNVLMDVAATVSTAEGNTKIHWLLDALDISCIAEYPSTALRFVGLLSGCCCKYMPLLLVDPETVLSDLPVTLPSLLSETRWSAVVESAANKLWATTERICTWALQVAGNEDDLHRQGSISSDEAPNSAFLARILCQTCVSLKDYLPVQKQLRLANLEISKL